MQSSSKDDCGDQNKNQADERALNVGRVHGLRKYIRIPYSRKCVIANRIEPKGNEAAPETKGR